MNLFKKFKKTYSVFYHSDEYKKYKSIKIRCLCADKEKEEDKKYYIYFRSINKIENKENGKKRYLVWSIVYSYESCSFEFLGEESFVKKIDSRNRLFELWHNEIVKGTVNPEPYVPMFKQKEISPEVRAKRVEQGKKLAESKKQECPFCFHKNFSIRKKTIIECKECSRKFAIDA